jgi:pimeloyl-ACP methyl ester carboxylesterase
MQHGLFSSSDAWTRNRDLSPAFRAAKAGYDVWLGNNRGTKYSREHETLSATSDKTKKDFFDYSFYELGQYDAPA